MSTPPALSAAELAPEVVLLSRSPVSFSGVRVVQVEAMQQAVDVLTEGRTALLLVDDAHVEADGGEALRSVCKVTQELGGPPVVLLARESVAPELIELAWRSGVDDCILRPLVAEAVRARVLPGLHDLSVYSGRSAARRGRVALCGFDGHYLHRARELLELSGFEVLALGEGEVPSADQVAAAEMDAVCVVSGGDGLAGIDLLSRALASLRQSGCRERTHTIFVSRGGTAGSGEGNTHLVDLAAPVEALVERLNKVLNMASTALLTKERVPFFCPIDFRSAGGPSDGVWQSGFSFNVSTGGLFVRTLLPLRKGSAIEMRIQLTTMREAVTATGVVAWANAPRRRTAFSYPVGMGVAFLGALSPRLTSLIEMCRASLGPPGKEHAR